MKFSVKSDYAARAVLGLARHFPSGKAVRVDTLAAEQSIPANYLIQILIDLKAGGVVRSLRGKEGGYMLNRPPAQITLGDVLRASTGAVFEAAAVDHPDCPEELRSAWLQLQRSVESEADSINFQHLADETSQKKMWYI